MSFIRPFYCCIYSQFRTKVPYRRRRVERVCWSIVQNDDISCRLGPCCDCPNHFIHVMNIDIIVDDDDHLCKGKLSCTPEAHHNLLSLAWISFLYRDNSQPFEPCSFGKVHINYFWLYKFHQRQECLFHNLSYVCILHNRFANNSCQINRIFLHHYTSQMKRRKWLGFSVIASMVSKRPLRPHVLRVNITFKDDLCSRRNFQVNCLALDKPYTFAPNYTCIKIFVQPFWHWCYRCIDNGRVCSYNHSNFCFFPHLLVQCVMVSSSFMNLPVHSCSSLIIYLHSVYAEIPASSFWILCDYHSEGYESTSIFWP